MEASWRGCSLRLDAETLELDESGQPPVVIPVRTVSGFTIFRSGAVTSDRPEGVHTPDAELVVAWRPDDGAPPKSASVPVPSEALQVQLFLARLAQLRPDADLRALPPTEAVARLGLPPARPLPERKELPELPESANALRRHALELVAAVTVVAVLVLVFWLSR